MLSTSWAERIRHCDWVSPRGPHTIDVLFISQIGRSDNSNTEINLNCGRARLKKWLLGYYPWLSPLEAEWGASCVTHRPSIAHLPLDGIPVCGSPFRKILLYLDRTPVLDLVRIGWIPEYQHMWLIKNTVTVLWTDLPCFCPYWILAFP